MSGKKLIVAFDFDGVLARYTGHLGLYDDVLDKDRKIGDKHE